MTARHRISDRNVLVIGIWDFDIVWNLSIVIWDFSAVFGKANRFYLNQLEADFDVSLGRALDLLTIALKTDTNKPMHLGIL